MPSTITLNEDQTRTVSDLLTGITFTDPADPLVPQVTVTDSSGTTTDLTTGSLAMKDDVITLDPAIIDKATEVTATFWLKTSKTGPQGVISGAKSDDDNNEYLLFLNSATSVAFWSAGTSTSWSGLPSLADDQWHHIAMVADANNDAVTLYLDRVSQGSKSFAFDAFEIAANGLVVGQDQDDVGGKFQPSQTLDGNLDELAIWRRALSADQIATIFTAGVTRVPDDLAAYYPFNDGSGNTIRDSSGNGRDGVLTSYLPTTDPHYTTVDPGAKPQWSTESAVAERAFVALDEGTSVLTITVHDGDGGTAVAQSTIQVLNLPPIANFPVPIESGNRWTFDASQSTDPGPLDAENLTYRWEVSSVGAGLQQTFTGMTFDFTPPFAGTYNIELTVTDPGGLSDTTALSITSHPFADISVDLPLFGGTNTFEVNEGDTIRIDATGSSPLAPFGNSSRVYHWEIFDEGIGFGGPIPNAPILEFTPRVRGFATINLTIEDTVDGVTLESLERARVFLSVANVAPVLEIGDDLFTDEGVIFTITPAIIDPGANEFGFNYEWELPDGIEQLTFDAPTFQFRATDNGVYEIGLTVDDGGDFFNNFGGEPGFSELDTLTVTVANLPPTINSINADGDLSESSLGGNGTLLSVNFLDAANEAGGDDGILRANDSRSFDFVWELGDGSPSQTTTRPFLVHFFPDSGTYDWSVTVIDKDGGTADQQGSVTIENEAPAGLNLDAPDGAEDDLLLFSGSFSDLDGVVGEVDLEPVRGQIDYGDGSVRDLVFQSSTDGTMRTYTFATGHAYRRGGDYSVTVTVWDDDGGMSQVTESISVSHVNDDPRTGLDRIAITADSTATSINVLRNDSSSPDPAETLVVTDVTSGLHGGITSIDTVSGQVLYTPRSGFVGIDRFTYTLSDGNGGTADGDVIVNVMPVDVKRLVIDTSGAFASSSLEIRFIGSLVEVTDLVNGVLLESRNVLPLEQIDILGRDDVEETFSFVVDSAQLLTIENGIQVNAGSGGGDIVRISGTAAVAVQLLAKDSTTGERVVQIRNDKKALAIRAFEVERFDSSYPLVDLDADQLDVGDNTVSVSKELNVESFKTITIGGPNGPGTLNAFGGIEIDFGGKLAGLGTISGTLVNQGLIAGPDPNSGGQLILSGTLKGAGNFTGSIVITGSFQPGNSPAEVSFDGDLAFADSTSLEIEVVGSGATVKHDRLVVAGNFAADGTLNVRPKGVSLSATGGAGTLGLFERLPILQAKSITGQFDAELVQSITPVNAGLYLDVLQTDTAIELVVMPTTWQNPLKTLDVNFDGRVSPVDALIVINTIIDRGTRILGVPSAKTGNPPLFFYDTNGDGTVSPLDALVVINRLIQLGSGSAEGEFSFPESYVAFSGNSVCEQDSGIELSRISRAKPATRSTVLNSQATSPNQQLEQPLSSDGQVSDRTFSALAKRETWNALKVDSALLDIVDELVECD
ncbi:MAG: cadherin-like domain-containing protein [Planctomycetales bacterium]|nr:cadherin-like domain-containing protein [Planctomycetales bacterium]